MQIHRQKIQQIKTKACEEIEKVLEWLEFDFDTALFTDTEIRGCCPVHGGDNPSAFSIWKDKGYWQCFTQGCHGDKSKDIVDLVQKVMTRKLGREVSFIQAVKMLANKVGIEVDGLFIEDNLKELDGIKTAIPTKIKEKQSNITPIPIELIDQKSAADRWFPKLGFSEETLNHFHVRYCNTKDKPMYMRSFAPILSDDRKFAIGFTGRINMDECHLCKKIHHPNLLCPDDGGPKPYVKWKHYGFCASTVLYNSWDEECIDITRKTGKIFLCEGPKDVWWLHQHNIRNVVAFLGTAIHDWHIMKMASMGVTRVIMALDNDQGGLAGSEKIVKKIEQAFKIDTIMNFMQEGEDVADIKDTAIIDKIAALTL